MSLECLIGDLRHYGYSSAVVDELNAIVDLGLTCSIGWETSYVTVDHGGWPHTVASESFVKIHVGELGADLTFWVDHQRGRESVSTPHWEQVDA